MLRSDLPNTASIAFSDFPNRGLNAVTEAGLYRLIMRSDKSSALDFQDWIAETVLPSIRQHGGYILGQETLTPEGLAQVHAETRRIAGLDPAEEREARSDAFRLLGKTRGRSRPRSRYRLC